MKKTKTWSTLSSQEVYQNDWIKVREDIFVQPNGKEGLYGVIELKEGGLGVVAVDKQYRVYLLEQYRYPVKNYSLEIVNGGAKKNESLLEAAKRELLEEAGLIASNLVNLGHFYPSNGCMTERVDLFLARGLTVSRAEPEETEDIVIKVVPFSEALKMIEESKITDSFSIIGLLFAQRYLKK